MNDIGAEQCIELLNLLKTPLIGDRLNEIINYLIKIKRIYIVLSKQPIIKTLSKLYNVSLIMNKEKEVSKDTFFLFYYKKNLTYY